MLLKGHQQQLQCLSTLLSKGPPVATVMGKYPDFKEALNSNCNVQVFCFQKGPTGIFNV